MKQLNFFKTLLLLAAIVLPQGVTAYDFMADGLCYNINSDGTSVTVTYENFPLDDPYVSYPNLRGDITIPASVTNGEGATYTVTSIGLYAFAWCSGLSSVSIPNSVTSIDEHAFIACSTLKSIVVEAGNTKYDSRDNCNAIIETESNTLIVGCRSTIIPNSVTSIGNFAFSMRWGLTTVEIPNSVKSIGDAAFSGCSDLTSVTIPNSVTSIGDYAFNGCNGLTDLYSYIENPSSVSLGDDVFDGVPTSTCVLHVPAETAELYRAADQWSAFDNIDEMITGIDAIAIDRMGDGTYYNLLGQPVKNPTTGIYILDGKKVLVK